MTGGDGSAGRAWLDVRPRLLADTLALALSRHGYIIVEGTDTERPGPVDVAIVGAESSWTTDARVVITLPDDAGAPARVHLDGVELPARSLHLAGLGELLDGIGRTP